MAIGSTELIVIGVWLAGIYFIVSYAAKVLSAFKEGYNQGKKL